MVKNTTLGAVIIRLRLTEKEKTINANFRLTVLTTRAINHLIINTYPLLCIAALNDDI